MKKASIYTMHPAYKMEPSYRKRLKERTGRTFEEWAKIVKKDGPKDLTERRRWLREVHRLSTNYAHWVASADAGGADAYDPEALVEAQYEGDRGALRPVYERLLKAGFALGSDVKACPCQTMVPLYRKFVFAEIKPTTATRIDLGLALGTETPRGRLEALGGRAVGNRITHRVRIGSVKDVDAEVLSWLKAAYAHGAKQAERNPAVAAGKEAKVPADLAKAIKSSAAATATFAACTPRMRADWVAWIESAAKPETREKRIARTLEKLAAGEKRNY